MSLARTVSALLLAALVVSAGCAAGPSADSPTPDSVGTEASATTTATPERQPARPSGGYAELLATVVTDTPEDATVVPFSNTTVQNSSYLTTVVEKAVEAGDGVALVRVDESNYETVRRQHESLPLVFQLDDGTQTAGVVYVRHEGHVVMLSLGGVVD
jgi:hypothetical protein